MLKRFTTRLHRFLVQDPSLVALPPGVETCRVFRNAVTDDEEQLIYDELSQVLKKCGERAVLDTTGTVKSVATEMIGFESTLSFNSGGSRKNLFGLVWSPTLITAFSRLPQDLFGSAGGGAGEDPSRRITWARVFEHHYPGLEMHIPMASSGRFYVYLNLLSDTVMTFDDEATRRHGQVFLPQRSLMFCSGEVRWGWRIGEQSVSHEHFFVSGNSGVRKRVETDLRLGVFGHALSQQLIDMSSMDGAAAERRRLLVDPEEAAAVPSAATSATTSSGETDSTPAPKMVGPLGGELVQKPTKSKVDMIKEVKKYSSDMRNVQFAVQDLDKRLGAKEPVNERWLNTRVGPQVHEPDEYGYDPECPERTMEHVNSMIGKERAKLYEMNYDGKQEPPEPPEISIKRAAEMMKTMTPEAAEVFGKIDKL